jgi:Exo-beta-D-glucosaminidase Ig-fold domain
MLDYVSHRAIFEGMNAHLWAPNSGRMLWMTQPAWPSNVWQIFSHDYDTQSSYYGVKKACEPVHIQLDLSNYHVDVVNTTTVALAGLSLRAQVFGLDNKLLTEHEEKKDVAANSLTAGFALDLSQFLPGAVVLVKLELRDESGKLRSDNLYWLGAESSSYRALGRLAPANLEANAVSSHEGNTVRVHVKLTNRGDVAAIQNKLTLKNAADGSRILPAYYSDNYVSLLPGESKQIEIEYPVSAGKGLAQIGLRGWNIPVQTIQIGTGK